MDDLEGRLRDLGQRARASITTAPPPAPSIAKRARRRRVVASLGAGSLAVLVAVGAYAGASNLGGRTVRTTDGDVLRAAAEATEEQGTARAGFEMSMSVSGEGMSNEVDAKGVAELDFERNRSHMRMTMEGMPFLESDTIEIIQEGDSVYTKGQLPGSEGKWVKVGAPDGDEGGLMASFPGAQQGSPADFLGDLRTVSGEIEVLGEEEIDGVPVTHYRATIDPDRLLEEMSTDSRQRFEETFSDLETDFEPVDAWVDDQGLVRRMEFALAVEGTGDFEGMGDFEVSMEMDFSMWFYDFGRPVQIEIPAPSDVIDADDLEAGGGGDEDEVRESEENLAFVYGEGGESEPYVSATWGGRVPILCVVGSLPQQPAGAKIVETSSGDLVASLEGDAFTTQRGVSVACLHHGIPEDLSRLVDSPDDYVLHIEGTGGVETIQLMRAKRLR